MNLFEQQSKEFVPRHIGTVGKEKGMLKTIGVGSLEELIDKTVPSSIRIRSKFKFTGGHQ